MIRIHLKSDAKMSNRQWHIHGKPYWWARIGDNFLSIPRVRGDNMLDIYVDIEKEPPFVIHYGVGSKNKYGVRETLKAESSEVQYPLYDYESSLDYLRETYALSQFTGMTYDEILAKIQKKLLDTQGYIDLDQKALEHYAQSIFDGLYATNKCNRP